MFPGIEFQETISFYEAFPRPIVEMNNCFRGARYSIKLNNEFFAAKGGKKEREDWIGEGGGGRDKFIGIISPSTGDERDERARRGEWNLSFIVSAN